MIGGQWQERSGGESPDDAIEHDPRVGEWIGEGWAGCSFPDARFTIGLRKVLDGMAGRFSKSKPLDLSVKISIGWRR
jgi:hypothetical protein